MAAILVVERADDLVVHVGDREGGLKGSSRRHGADRSCGGRRRRRRGGSNDSRQAAATAAVKRTGATQTHRAGSPEQAPWHRHRHRQEVGQVERVVSGRSRGREQRELER